MLSIVAALTDICAPNLLNLSSASTRARDNYWQSRCHRDSKPATPCIDVEREGNGKGKPLCWPSTCSSLMGDADKHRDFAKHIRETVMTNF